MELEPVKGIEPSSSAWKSLAAGVISRPIPTNGLQSCPLSANDYFPLSERPLDLAADSCRNVHGPATLGIGLSG
jgi:hypothetical protein